MDHIETPEAEPAWEDFSTFAPAYDERLNPQSAPEFDGVSTEVEGLLYLGYLTRDFTLYGHQFSIRTLSRAERLAATQLAAEHENTLGYADALQTALISASIVLCDNKPLSTPLSPEESKNPIVWIRRNYAIVSRWYDPILEGIYNEIDALLMDQTRAFLELEGK